MKGNLWSIALFFLALYMVISSYAASSEPYQIRKLLGIIDARPSSSRPTGQCC
ncbi:PREDICTED: uncharacterized protein LOC104777898 [Camelina sativa]|uniref:Uncharacterized protein LOC104777898 n=1 Tax=Camelina sativa TaxID=90675 RepID=A0ABM0YGG9_CAMSA|nr:PREDICTED: uncharacterized protein LOC104777898 [Camelina sativa]